MNVLLAGSFTGGDLFSHRWVTPPLGVWRIASYLNAYGHYAEVYDQNKPGSFGTVEFGAILQSKTWDILAFSVLTATIEYDLAKIHEAKKLCPNALIVAGGSGAALDYQFVLDNAPVDIVVTAEGEYPMLDICNGKPLHEIPGIVFKTKARTLTDDDYWEITKTLNVEAMGADKYWAKTASMYDEPDLGEINTFRLFTQNYCPMNCAFCTLTKWRQIACGGKTPVVGLSPERVVEMIARVESAYPGLRQIFFVDDDFFLKKDRTIEILGMICDGKDMELIPEDLRFICLTNINRIDAETVDLAAKAGFRVLSIGVESVSQHVLDSLNKKQTVEQIWENTQLILDAGIKPYYTLLMFTPYGDADDLLTDLKGFRKLSEMGAGLSLEPYLIPLPGTPLSEARVPESTRMIPIEGTDKEICKGFAWLPTHPHMMNIFRDFEAWYPKYRRYRFDKDGVKHKEKNYQAQIILDAVEMVLKYRFAYQFDGKFEIEEVDKTYEMVAEMDDANVDVMGDIQEFQH